LHAKTHLLKFDPIEDCEKNRDIRNIGVGCLESDYQKVKGVVGEVGLERDGERFNAFNVTVSVVVDSGKALTFDQGEQLIKQYRKELLGKKVEVAAIVVLCPVCGKGFNTEQGMRQHARMVHEKKKKKAEKKTKKRAAGKKGSRKKTS
jgi:hypothetical protein